MAWCFKLKQIEKSYSLIIVFKNDRGPFLTKKVVKKGYCGNESLDVAWDRVEVSQMTLFDTTHRCSHPELFYKIAVPHLWSKTLRLTCKGVCSKVAG